MAGSGLKIGAWGNAVLLKPDGLRLALENWVALADQPTIETEDVTDIATAVDLLEKLLHSRGISTDRLRLYLGTLHDQRSPSSMPNRLATIAKELAALNRELFVKVADEVARNSVMRFELSQRVTAKLRLLLTQNKPGQTQLSPLSTFAGGPQGTTDLQRARQITKRMLWAQLDTAERELHSKASAKEDNFSPEDALEFKKALFAIARKLEKTELPKLATRVVKNAVFWRYPSIVIKTLEELFRQLGAKERLNVAFEIRPHLASEWGDEAEAVIDFYGRIMTLLNFEDRLLLVQRVALTLHVKDDHLTLGMKTARALEKMIPHLEKEADRVYWVKQVAHWKEQK